MFATAPTDHPATDVVSTTYCFYLNKPENTHACNTAQANGHKITSAKGSTHGH